jgi:gliding motility-associated lipoprotein GldH
VIIHRFTIFAAVLSCLFWTACGEQPIYSEMVELPDDWTYDNNVEFDLPASDTFSTHDLILEIGHNKDYPFQNIYLNIITKFPSGKIEQNKLNIDLADRAGWWYGDCGRNTCILEVLMLPQFSFSETGTYALTFEQYTRTNDLVGIESLRLKLY